MNVFMAGLNTAHQIVTISHGYGGGCQTPEGGWVLDGVFGITTGCWGELWMELMTLSGIPSWSLPSEWWLQQLLPWSFSNCQTCMQGCTAAWTGFACAQWGTIAFSQNSHEQLIMFTKLPWAADYVHKTPMSGWLCSQKHPWAAADYVHRTPMCSWWCSQESCWLYLLLPISWKAFFSFIRLLLLLMVILAGNEYKDTLADFSLSMCWCRYGSGYISSSIIRGWSSSCGRSWCRG